MSSLALRVMDGPSTLHDIALSAGAAGSRAIDNSPLTEARIEACRTRLSQIRTALTVWVPFFGHLLLKMDPKIATPDMGVKTMGVSRDRKLFLNVGWCEQLSDAEFTGVLCHEVMHLAYLVFERQGPRKAVVVSPYPCGACGSLGKVLIEGREAQGPQDCPKCDGTGTEMVPTTLWNIAHDYAINGIIDEMTRGVSEVTLPAGGCLDHKYDEMSAEEIYDDIIDNALSNGGGGEGNGSTLILPKGSWGTDDLRDDLGGKGEGDGDGEGEGDGDGKGKGDGEGEGEGGNAMGNAPSGQGGNSRSEAQNRSLDQYWKVAVCEAAQVHEQSRGKGTLPGALQKLIDEITDPKISWIDVLSRWVGENGRRADFTYRRQARRSESAGAFLPSLQRHGVDDLVVLWDTSGSMNGREVEIFSEIIGICDDLNMGLRVICCDTMIHSDQEDVREVEDVDVKGGGGSNFIPAFDLLHEEGYQGVVVAFTDGYIDVPGVKPPHIRDVLWVLWEGRDVDPTGGKWGEALVVDKEGNQVGGC